MWDHFYLVFVALYRILAQLLTLHLCIILPQMGSPFFIFYFLFIFESRPTHLHPLLFGAFRKAPVDFICFSNRFPTLSLCLCLSLFTLGRLSLSWVMSSPSSLVLFHAFPATFAISLLARIRSASLLH